MSSNKTVERSGAFRPLTDSERHLLSTLLNCEFPGNVSLRKQFSTVMGRQIDDNGSLELQTRGGPFAEVVRRIPVEAEIKDSDGVTIHILIHVIGGHLNELEIYREDSQPVLHLETKKIQLIVL